VFGGSVFGCIYSAPQHPATHPAASTQQHTQQPAHSTHTKIAHVDLNAVQTPRPSSKATPLTRLFGGSWQRPVLLKRLGGVVRQLAQRLGAGSKVGHLLGEGLPGGEHQREDEGVLRAAGGGLRVCGRVKNQN